MMRAKRWEPKINVGTNVPWNVHRHMEAVGRARGLSYAGVVRAALTDYLAHSGIPEPPDPNDPNLREIV